ncbi:MAG: aromatic ring-hydroxylating dioxygenase subunit alpha [Gammaproteobacteria bacterium]|nr:aromatic ring-hydroxylating dioxygenase subunit alpha [Gammaproteobacteria bacterium]
MATPEEMHTLTQRALAHFIAGTTDQAPAIMANPITAYTDPVRYRREVDGLFRHLPLALALSIELPQAHTYRAMQVLGVPVLLLRGGDGEVRAFLNVCRHRGARLCEPGAGSARVITCPYHAWSYDDRGSLVSRYGAPTFGDLDHATRGLTPLACAERAGLVWVCLTPGETPDVDAWLGDFAAELGTLQLDRWAIFEQRELPGPGWKVAIDGYLEAYHHNCLHGKTVGQLTVGNLLVQDTYGPHQRLTFGRRSLRELQAAPTLPGAPGQHIRLIHSGFPNLSISGILGDHCLVSQLFPGPTPDTTITRQTVLVHAPPTTPAARAASELFSAMVLQAVRDEDYPVGLGIQAGIGSGANEAFLYGRNEPAVQHYHRTVDRLMAALAGEVRA